jgi:hypothetical protein
MKRARKQAVEIVWNIFEAILIRFKPGKTRFLYLHNNDKYKLLKRVLFIDRDGTLINEAPPTYQIDSFSKLEFYPHMFEYMSRVLLLFLKTRFGRFITLL